MPTRRNVVGALVLAAVLGGGLVLLQRVGYPLESFLPGSVAVSAERVNRAVSSPNLVLDVPPAEMRSGLAAAYRLAPDRRYLLAIGHIHQFLTGSDAGPAEATWDSGQWKLVYRGEAVGKVAQYADFGEWQTLLTGWAKRLGADHPPGLAGPGPGDAETRALLEKFDAIHALRVVEGINRRWEDGDHRAADMAAAAHALVIMKLQGFDRLGIADAFDARVLASMAIAGAFTDQDLRRQEALLADALGQAAHASVVASTLPDNDPVRLYVTDANDALRAVASDRHASAEARYLYLSRLQELGDPKAFAAWLRAFYRGQVTLPVLRAVVGLHDFGITARLAPVLPYITVMAVENGLDQATLDIGDVLDINGSPVGLANTGRLSLDSGSKKLARRLESALDRLGDDVGGPFLDATEVAAYYRAYFYSGAFQAAKHFSDALSSVEATRDYAAYLEPLPDGVGAEFARWYGSIALSEQGKVDIGRLEDDLSSLTTLGAIPLKRTFDELLKRSNFTEPRVFAAAKKLVARLDDRIENRRLLSSIAYGTLLDLGLYERLARSVMEASGEAPAMISYAKLTGDVPTLSTLLESEQVPARTRIAIPGHLRNLGVPDAEVNAAYLRLVDTHGDDWDIVDPYVRYLEEAGRYGEARERARRWLVQHGRHDGFPYIFASTAIARQYYHEGRYREGLEVVGPVISSYQAGAMARGALLLERMGEHKDAEAVGQALVERYPGLVLARATLMEIYWRQDRIDEATRLVTAMPHNFGMAEWRKVGETLVEVFRDDPARGEVAFLSLRDGGVSPYDLMEVAASVHQNADPEFAFRVGSQIKVSSMAILDILVRAYGDLKRARGEDEAIAWLRGKVPAHLRNPLSLFAYSNGRYELLWRLIDDPGQGNHAEAVWLYRAAAHMRQGRPAGPEADTLDAHFAESSDNYYHVLGRFLMGLVSDEEILALSNSAEHRCELAYFLGARAEAAGRNYEAAEWYRVAVETGLYKEGEYRWAHARLLAWNNKGASLDRAGPAVFVLAGKR